MKVSEFFYREMNRGERTEDQAQDIKQEPKSYTY